MTYQMISPSAVDWFRKEREAGRMPNRLPEGAFDVMTPRLKRRLAQDALSPPVKKALDAMSRPTRDAIRNHLTTRDLLPGEEPDEEEQEQQEGDQEMQAGPEQQTPPATLPSPALDEEEVERVCDALREAGVPEEAIAKVRERLAGEGDGDLLLQHKGDRRPFTTKKAYDTGGLGAGPSKTINRVIGERRTSQRRSVVDRQPAARWTRSSRSTVPRPNAPPRLKICRASNR
jgi:hypothetical protein